MYLSCLQLKCSLIFGCRLEEEAERADRVAEIAEAEARRCRFRNFNNLYQHQTCSYEIIMTYANHPIQPTKPNFSSKAYKMPKCQSFCLNMCEYLFCRLEQELVAKDAADAAAAREKEVLHQN